MPVAASVCLFAAFALAAPPAPEPSKTEPQNTPKACLADAVPHMVCVPGGPTVLGTDDDHRCDQGENRRHATRFGPARAVFVDTVYLDLTEVTVGAYQACVKQKRCPAFGPSYSDFSRPAQPITAVSWFAARAFCRAQGKRLPTEAEWERAAQGDAPAACPAVVVQNDLGRSCGVKKLGSKPQTGRVLEVMEQPPNRHGLYAMRGNAEEWVDDWFDAAGPTTSPPCAGADRCPKHPLKMVKGGSWYWPAAHAEAWHRRPYRPENKPAHHFGFRCAAGVDAARTLAMHADEDDSAGGDGAQKNEATPGALRP